MLYCTALYYVRTSSFSIRACSFSGSSMLIAVLLLRYYSIGTVGKDVRSR